MDSDRPALELRPRLIALHGPDECGKDTIAEIIREKVEGSQMTIVTKAFADRVKIAIAACFGIAEADAVAWYDRLKKGQVVATSPLNGDPVNLTLTGREFIELFAETHKEQFGESFWADQVLPPDRVDFLRLWQLPEPTFATPDIALVTDLRYEVEYENLEALGGEVWGIIGRGVDGNAHEIPPKYVIDNSGGIDALGPQIGTLLASP